MFLEVNFTKSLSVFHLFAQVVAHADQRFDLGAFLLVGLLELKNHSLNESLSRLMLPPPTTIIPSVIANS